MDTKPRKYPAGKQIFSKIIKGNYVYVDKTDLVWKMANGATYTFLSRPRRFGKTLLTTTLHSYFEGDKELFDGLKIMEYETEWKKYPVVHVDLSKAKGKRSADDLRRYLNLYLSERFPQYDNDAWELPGERLDGIVQSMHNEYGEDVVVLIDEYDAPLLEVMHEKEQMQAFKDVMKEFYQSLKGSEDIIRFCFLTGITKFSQLSIFSSLNNIKNVSMLPEYATICGISEEELDTLLQDDIDMLAQKLECTSEEARAMLKRQYDGYHFTKNSPDVYNPYSLMNCFSDGEIQNYWFESGTPTMLINMIKRADKNITTWEQADALATLFDAPSESLDDLTPLLYQSGYLTIKGYNPKTRMYHLEIPNQEVRIGMAEGLLPVYSGLRLKETQSSFGAQFYMALLNNNIDLALRELKTFLARIPYVNGFKEKLNEISIREGFYEYTLYLIFSTLNAFTRTQVNIHGGRIDMVVEMPKNIYIFEFKIEKSAYEALAQIDQRRYAEAFDREGMKVVKVGVQFDIQNWTILDWKIKE